MTTTKKTYKPGCSACRAPYGAPHADDCRAVAAVRAQDAEHRAYLDATPDAWEHHHGRG